MFHMPTIKFWRFVGFIILALCFCFVLLGTLGMSEPIVYRWDTNLEPNTFGGKWLLWAMLILTILSFFTTTSFTKPTLGQITVNEETASALAIGCMWIFTGADIIIVIYAFYPISAIPIIGIIIIILVFLLFLVISAFRKKRS